MSSCASSSSVRLNSMKMQERRLALPLLGVLVWVLSIHSGTYAGATLLPIPITGAGLLRTSADQREPPLPHAYDRLLVTPSDLNDSVVFAERILDTLHRLEANLVSAKVILKDGTPSQGEFAAGTPEVEALQRGRQALRAVEASIQLVVHMCGSMSFNYKDCARFMNRFSLDGTPLGSSCEHLTKKCTAEEYGYMYRSGDGLCNNGKNGAWGEAFTAYARLLPADYLDGIRIPHRAVNKRPLPNPRLVSLTLVTNTGIPTRDLTLAVMQWGQFLEHDLSRTAVSVMIHSDNTIRCCNSDNYNLSPRYIHPLCSPIEVPASDEYYHKHNVGCMNFVRSVPAVRSDCSFGHAEQLNQATHFLDGSQIYGATANKTASLRAFYSGRLKVSKAQFPPLSSHPTKDCLVSSDSDVCFTSGDSRVNFEPVLTAMHTLWFREHNRIADRLATLNKDWDDEVIFQEARRIVIAEIQHITYNEWMNKVLAPRYVRIINRLADYSPNTNPSVSNSFATSVMRAMKSLYSGKIWLVKEGRLENASVLNLHEHYNRPGVIQKPGVLDEILRGFTTQSSQKLDFAFTDDLVNKLYSDGNYGYDQLSLDIARGRDHGLPGYNQFRELCGYPLATSFEDFSDVMSQENIEALQKIYNDPADVDLIIGGLAETPHASSVFGPTFSCIAADQLLRTRRGDRFFYSNPWQPKPFTSEQLKEIKKTTFARIICDNAEDIKQMQPEAFKKLSDSNKLVNCDNESLIPKLNFIPWANTRDKYSY
ncbi:unnamed protein product [Acanthoscelides obtectus]|uniref:Peroxidase n=3 Tax=Acanthoscelides obtectus TaxID=200917 RepID=A0A9P0PF27_ACAOB|nr:unnamed protein product [Acanthoscelides obtectus]CAK1632836.1 Peroxidase [Acanthoscelides obtectus]